VSPTSGTDAGSASAEDRDPIDPRTVARAARLLRWYPGDWRIRYGDEFETTLYSSLADGKGGVRLSFDVAKEGLVARLNSAGFIGTMAQPLTRARASVAAIFVGIVGFLVGTTLLSHYVERWRAYPTTAALEKVNRESIRLSREAKYLSPSAAKHLNQVMNNRVESAFADRASGAPVIFNRIVHISVDVTIACLVGIFVVAVVGCLKTYKTRSRSRLILPAALFLAAGGLFVVREIAYHSDWVIGSFGFWSELWQIMHGQFRLWPAVVFPLCTLIAIFLLVLGGAILLRRAELGARLCAWVGRLARGAAVFSGVALASTLIWAATLSVQAPGFLTWTSQGVLGISLLPVFVLAVLAMTGACFVMVTASTRCLRIVRQGSTSLG
jgi:hypothetical protein